MLEQVTQSQIQALIDGSSKASSLSKQDRTEIARLLCDPQYEAQQVPESLRRDGAGEDRQQLLRERHHRRGSHGGSRQDLEAEHQFTRHSLGQGIGVRDADDARARKWSALLCRRWLPTCKPPGRYALTAHQKDQIEAMIKYFHGGNVEDFRQASIAWVRDRADSHVDFMIGWVEFIGDFLSRMACLGILRADCRPRNQPSRAGAGAAAQDFEDAMPYGTFKKKFPADYSPPALMVYYFQEISGFRSGGYNLPQFRRHPPRCRRQKHHSAADAG